MHRDDFLEAQRLTRNVTAEFPGARMTADDKVAKLAVVGVGMRSHAGVATQLFESLARQGVKALLISTSEIKIACWSPKTSSRVVSNACTTICDFVSALLSSPL